MDPLHRYMDLIILYDSENNIGFGLKELTTVNQIYLVTKGQTLSSSNNIFIQEVTASSHTDLGSLLQEVKFNNDMFLEGVR